MISFSKLGNLGRLGNQMFQYSYLRGQANRMGVEYACPSWEGDNIFTLGESRRVTSEQACEHSYREPKDYCGFNSSALSIADETDMWGFFQTPRYFLPETRAWYRFRKQEPMPELSGFTSIHMRFGDYLDLKHVYPELGTAYYQRAIELIGAKRLAIFSDDPSLAREKAEGLTANEILYFEDRTEAEDLFAIASCGSHITSNSSFSWWGAWLSFETDAPVICTRTWFASDWPTQNRDIYPARWHPI